MDPKKTLPADFSQPVTWVGGNTDRSSTLHLMKSGADLLREAERDIGSVKPLD